MLLPSHLLPLIQTAFNEDLLSGDVSTESTVPETQRAVAEASAKSELVICGGDLFRACFVQLDPHCAVESVHPDGARVAPGDVIWRVTGLARPLLMAERTALNFVQRLSGIASLTRRYVQELPKGCNTRIVDTRKTTPGLRRLERYAVRVGGGHNHRDNLGSAVMLKDNHITLAGSIATAIERARSEAPHTCRIEIEVETLEQVREALAAQADIIMLDNFAPEELRTAVNLIAGRAIVEVSGGVTLSRIPELAAAGVDVISIGALTHSAPAADISLNLKPID